MYSVENRPFTEEEKRPLEETTEHIFFEWKGNYFLKFIFSLAISLLFAMLLFPRLVLHFFLPVSLGSMILSFFVARYVIPKIKIAKRNREIEELRRELAENKVEVWHFEANDAIKVEEFEDEGVGFFIKLSEDKILFLQGQYLYDVEEKKKFPNTKFSIVRTPRSRIVLNIQCYGDYLTPSRTRKFFVVRDYKEDRVPKDGQIISGNKWSDFLK